jgi:hypothetical protein
MNTFYTHGHDDDNRFQCRHIFPDGHRCGSPCLRAEELCYYHHTTRRPIADAPARKARRGAFNLNLADLVDRSGIQIAIAEVLQRIAANDIDPRRAGLLLYGLQTASLNLPKAPAKPQPVVLVDEVVEHPTLGTLAPPARIADLEPRSRVSTLLDELRAMPRPNRPQPEPEAEAPKPKPFDLANLPQIQACEAPSAPLQSTPNPNPLRTLHKNRGEGGYPKKRAPRVSLLRHGFRRMSLPTHTKKITPKAFSFQGDPCRSTLPSTNP